MINGAAVTVVIPALNEERAIGKVLSSIPDRVDDVVVVDNGSTDETAHVAREHGARLVFEPRRGYGAACLSGIGALEHPDVVAFLDRDFSDHPEETPRVVDPIIKGTADMVIGSRGLGRREAGALTPQARFGNRLACMLIRWFWKVRYTDLGPFRATSLESPAGLGLRDPNYGRTVEMQIKAAKQGLRVTEVPVSYRRRIGKSKVSGTVKGVIAAYTKTLFTILAAALSKRRPRPRPQEKVIVFTRYPDPDEPRRASLPNSGPTAPLLCTSICANTP